MKVLVVDDEALSRRLLQRYLESWGYEVVLAGDGEGAWEKFGATDYPIVVSDWVMPGLSGPDLFRRIRQCERPGYVYLILLTSKVEKKDLVEGMEAGADDFVSKPFDPDELRVRVREGERIARLTRAWTEELGEALTAAHGEERAKTLLSRFAFPPAYRDDVSAAAAVADLAHLDALGANDLATSLGRADPGGSLRLKLYRTGQPLPLSDVMPLLENLGVRVADQRPYEVGSAGGRTYWIHDFGLQAQAGDLDGDGDGDGAGRVFQDAFLVTWRGQAENDGFNRLVLRAGLTWQEVGIVRAYAKYLRQAGNPFSQAYIEEALAANAEVARLLVALFRARFDPARQPAAQEEAAALATRLAGAIDAVPGLDQDRILRRFAAVVQATVRTSWFQTADPAAPEQLLALKLDPARVGGLPTPLPRHEVFVYSPRTEGLHLRGGTVARGGIRHSDRREDFRGEVVGLMKTQTVKNAVIVPVGAKGAFVVKAPPEDGAGLAAEVAACYRTFISGLLALTDNIVGGAVVHPPGVVIHDGDDPYLVVAPDKGTATFSDLANGIAADHGFWLGDAFASGGSTGYDHKALAITARGAWESVKRHFRALGKDPERDVITVVGIGDMSGDVFGNGMLRSRSIELLAAFDHRHVFLDPDPDPAGAYRERERLFHLSGSSWADYAPAAISPGGGVFPRDSKAIPVSAEARAALGVDAEVLSGEDLIRAIMCAPVDLLWNGGVGTYVKARGEGSAEVGDKANDAVRVDAADLRVRVVAEGGNLGCTQRGRIEYALAGGRIHTDAIDNSAGVDCSDHEVNIKILLDAVVADGGLSRPERDRLLAEMAEEVAGMVLRDNYEQTAALAIAGAAAPVMADVHARYLRALDDRLDRALEVLPDDAGFARRRAARLGLVAPELAVLLAHTKLDCYERLLASSLPEDSWCREELAAYFPGPLRERFADAMLRHPLHREIVATRVTNTVVNRAGPSFLFRMQEATRAPMPELVRAHTAAWRIFTLDGLWTRIEALDGRVPAGTQVDLFRTVRLVAEYGTRWLVRHRRPVDVDAAVEEFAAGAAALAERPHLLPASEREKLRLEAQAYEPMGVPAPLARRVVALGWMDPALDLVELAGQAGRPVQDAARIWFALGERLGLDWLRDRVDALPWEDRWQTLARYALQDGYRSERAALCAQALAAGSVDAWLQDYGDPARSLLAILEEIRAVGPADVTTLSVAVQAARNLARDLG